MKKNTRSAALPTLLLSAATINPSNADEAWTYGAAGGLGYFNFRNSLYVDREPDPPGDLGEDWAELFIKPWLDFRKSAGSTEWFGSASWAYVRTDKNATPISGGAAVKEAFDRDKPFEYIMIYLSLNTG